MTGGDPRLERVLAHVRLPEGFPIRWSADGEALEWSDGTTVALREEVLDVLVRMARAERLAPPFPALALFLGVMRVTPGERPPHVDISYPLERSFLRALRVVRQLDLPRPLRPRDLAVVAAHVLERAGITTDSATSVRLARDLDVGLPSELLSPRPAAPGVTLHAFELVEEGLKRMEPDPLLRRLNTGLEEELAPASSAVLEELLVDAEYVRRTVEELAEDPRHALLARLTREVLAALSLPRPVGREEDLPLGGYSDIAPRGPLDRLLTSELAHDDATLAVRVALGEALYLRREAPPRRPIGARNVLVDAGVRLWGRARVFANAVALALGASAPPGARVRLHRAEGDDAREIDAGSRAGFEEHLGRPTPDLHPGDALPAFLERVDGGEVLVVTSAAGAEDPAFRARHADLARADATVVTVDADGALAVSTWVGGRRREGARARLDLAQVLARPARSRDADRLPAYVELLRPALRVPESTARGRVRVHPEGTLVLTRDRRLVLWPAHPVPSSVRKPRPYAEEVAILPKGHPRAFEVEGDEAVAVIAEGRLRLHTARWSRARGLEVRTVDLPGEARQVFLRRGRAVAVLRAQAVLVDEPDARPVGTAARAWSGRFCSDGSRLDVVAGRLVLEAAPSDAPAWFKGLFDRPGHPGPWSVQGSEVVSLADGTRIPLRRPGDGDAVRLWKKVQNVSQDGRYVWLADERIDLAEGLVHWTFGDPHHARAPGTDGFPEIKLRRSFDQVAVLESSLFETGLVLLQAKRGRRAAFTSGPVERLRLVTGDACPLPPADRRLTAEPVAADHPAARFLATVGLEDGSRVWLDRRGLLHLAAADPDLGEVTLVLRQDDTLWAWCSQGWVVGEPHELMEGPVVPWGRLVEWLRKSASSVGAKHAGSGVAP